MDDETHDRAMKASDLIASLHAMIEAHGDLPVTFDDCYVLEVCAYDETGSSSGGAMVEICLHGGPN